MCVARKFASQQNNDTICSGFHLILRIFEILKHIFGVKNGNCFFIRSMCSFKCTILCANHTHTHTCCKYYYIFFELRSLEGGSGPRNMATRNAQSTQKNNNNDYQCVIIIISGCFIIIKCSNDPRMYSQCLLYCASLCALFILVQGMHFFWKIL